MSSEAAKRGVPQGRPASISGCGRIDGVKKPETGAKHAEVRICTRIASFNAEAPDASAFVGVFVPVDAARALKEHIGATVDFSGDIIATAGDLKLRGRIWKTGPPKGAPVDGDSW